MKNIILITFIILLFALILNAEITVKIIQTSGETKVRYGLEEKWEKVSPGIVLKEIDTILTEENGEIILQFSNGLKFILGNNSILDIGDLREIREKELFLFLMSRKVEKLENTIKKSKLRIGNVSSVYGEDKQKSDTTNIENSKNSLAEKEINGAIALYIQKYYTNAVYKFHNLIDKYSLNLELGTIYFYIAKSFEALNKWGQAIDSYQQVVEIYHNKEILDSTRIEYLNKSQLAIQRLKSYN